MTHLPYIVASYGLTLFVIGYLSISAWFRTTAARRRLDALDPRGRK